MVGKTGILTETRAHGSIRAERSRHRNPGWMPLVERADVLFERLKRLKISHQDQKSSCARELIAALYRLHEYFNSNQFQYSAFMGMRLIEYGRSENPYFHTVEAIMCRHLTTKSKTLRTYYAQACYALKSEDVSADGALAWLNEPMPAGASGRTVTGLKKALHVWSQTDLGQRQLGLKAESKLSRSGRKIEAAFESSAGIIGTAKNAMDGSSIGGSGPVVILGKMVSGELKLVKVITTDPLSISTTLTRCGFGKTGK